MLQLLLDFVKKYPQKDREGKLNYVPFGGAAVRALEEDYHNRIGEWVREVPRSISDIDLLVLNSELRYPVHSTTINDVFNTGLYFTSNDIISNLRKFSLEGIEMEIPSPTLLLASKSVFVQPGREKDYLDCDVVSSIGFNEDRLAEFYEKCRYLPKNGKLVVDLLKDSLSYVDTNEKLGYKLFAAMPQSASIITSTGEENRGEVYKIISGYLERDGTKDAYQTSKVLGTIANSLDYVPSNSRIDVLNKMLIRAKTCHYSEFDTFINYRVIPSLKFAIDDSEKREALRSYGFAA